MYQPLDNRKICFLLPSIAFTSKHNSSQNKCSNSLLTKQGITSKKEQLLNCTVNQPSLSLHNRIVCKCLEVLFHLWNTGKKKIPGQSIFREAISISLVMVIFH